MKKYIYITNRMDARFHKVKKGISYKILKWVGFKKIKHGLLYTSFKAYHKLVLLMIRINKLSIRPEEAFESLELKFTSGNKIPVTRATILIEEWIAIKNKLKRRKIMNKPNKINILGIEYKIEYITSIEERDGNVGGEINFYTQTIKIYHEEENIKNIWKILIHEILHGIEAHIHLTCFECPTGHTELDAISTVLSDVLIRNKFLKQIN